MMPRSTIHPVQRVRPATLLRIISIHPSLEPQ